MQNSPKQHQQVKQLAELFDTKFQGPFGIRFGLDALLGLIPVVGDVSTTLVSLHIINVASTLGCSTSTLMRMALNVIIEDVIDLLPFVGNVFDFFWKSNTKNLELLERHLANPHRETVRSRFVLILIFAVILVVTGALGYLGYLAIIWVVELFRANVV